MTMTATQARSTQAAAQPIPSPLIATVWAMIEAAVGKKDGPEQVVTFEKDQGAVGELVNEFQEDNGYIVTQSAGHRITISWSGS